MAERRFPGKPFKHLVMSHHHMDHSNGARVFAAKGASVVFGPGNREYFEQLRAAVTATVDRRDRRILYVALGSFQNPVIARAALELILDPSRDYRETTQIAWTQSNTSQGAARTWRSR